jgi:hypothetical protein
LIGAAAWSRRAPPEGRWLPREWRDLPRRVRRLPRGERGLRGRDGRKVGRWLVDAHHGVEDAVCAFGVGKVLGGEAEGNRVVEYLRELLVHGGRVGRREEDVVELDAVLVCGVEGAAGVVEHEEIQLGGRASGLGRGGGVVVDVIRSGRMTGM